ncbi:hypothetical protein ACFFGT_24665 [Mucilaginibacter angelicae]|uniref:Uncharacterized protein n=1 Tax=Mucilaginibacter angelicae TaxID=869718 RepID=A0ABV6LD84_9SPHI
MEIIDTELFRKNLLATQQYCDLRLKNTVESVAHALRTINQYNEEALFSYELQPGNEYFETFVSVKWNINPIFSHDHSLYYKLFNSQLNYKKDFLNSTIIQDIDFNGRILISEIDMTVVDGASEAMSKGLIDLNDCTPIDTWFYMSEDEQNRYLFSWIPEPFVYLANEAVAVNCIDCIYWYEEYEF